MEFHPALKPLSWLFGIWESVEAEVFYPTMDTVNYTEVMEFLPTMQPVLEYKSETWHAVKKTKLHCERGFLRIDPDTGKKIALLVAHHYGITEVSEGTVDKESLALESQAISQMSFITNVATVKTVRNLALKGEELYLSILLQTGNQPLQQHLQSRYRKKT